jgi:hypothetical protein
MRGHFWERLLLDSRGAHFVENDTWYISYSFVRSVWANQFGFLSFGIGQIFELGFGGIGFGVGDGLSRIGEGAAGWFGSFGPILGIRS